ncbi:MAG: hypothetical protein ACMUIE_07285 [Thermoplasmatota archaeon]
MADLSFSARYPFLQAAREEVRGMELTMEDMLSEDSENIQRRALQRIEEAVEGHPVQEENPMPMGEEVELLSYPVSRFMVAAVGDMHLIKWFAHHEGERARVYLDREPGERMLDIGKEMGLEAFERAPKKAAETVRRPEVVKGVRPNPEAMTMERRSYWVLFADYLPPKRNISGSEWDLINQRLVEGYVELNKHQYTRLLQELVKKRVEEGLERKVSAPGNQRLKEMIGSLKAKIDARKKRYSPTDLGRMSITRLPPCMRQILGASQAGENLPHHARFALVAFLNAIGLSSEEIFRVFTSAPDFKEDIVRYQVEHITGTTSATSYSPPNCDTMKSGGICFNPDALCEKEWLSNPIKYYRIKGRKKRVRQEAPSS